LAGVVLGGRPRGFASTVLETVIAAVPTRPAASPLLTALAIRPMVMPLLARCHERSRWRHPHDPLDRSRANS
jgi:hypothetical protein